MFKNNAKGTDFFDLFIDTANDACKTAEMLYDLVMNYENIDQKISAIEDAEHQSDSQVHRILKQLNRSFITPIDREDIYMIAKELDNITDAIESTAHRFKMFNVTSITEEAKTLARLIVECTRELKDLMVELKNMKKSVNLGKKVIEVNRVEDEGDDIFRNAITKLFTSETNAVEIIKWKEIYEFLENTLDVCEDVANLVEGVVMKHT